MSRIAKISFCRNAALSSKFTFASRHTTIEQRTPLDKNFDATQVLNVARDTAAVFEFGHRVDLEHRRVGFVEHRPDAHQLRAHQIGSRYARKRDATSTIDRRCLFSRFSSVDDERS
jgi:hypothetical protein